MPVKEAWGLTDQQQCAFDILLMTQFVDSNNTELNPMTKKMEEVFYYSFSTNSIESIYFDNDLLFFKMYNWLKNIVGDLNGEVQNNTVIFYFNAESKRRLHAYIDNLNKKHLKNKQHDFLDSIIQNNPIMLPTNPTMERQQFQFDLQSLSTQDELAARNTLSKLQKITDRYYLHLQNQNSSDVLLNEKKELIERLKKLLDAPNEQINQRLKEAVSYLKHITESLEKHRDPIYLRFIRDFFRFILLLCSGIIFYQKCCGKPIHFFKSSHGGSYLQEVQSNLGLFGNEHSF